MPHEKGTRGREVQWVLPSLATLSTGRTLAEGLVEQFGYASAVGILGESLRVLALLAIPPRARGSFAAREAVCAGEALMLRRREEGQEEPRLLYCLGCWLLQVGWECERRG